ncbi:MAG: hypothetical protein IKV91_05205 [Bacteroidales bacterium]|nr:hypothetical protein [Bacteroidales bacterium]
MISIANDTLKITLHTPDGDKGYYRGTRFDWAGVFSSIGYRGCNYTEPWFETYSPLMHDAVCGPAEEFSPIGLDEPSFLKIGVGVLERMEGEYDRFKLHKILDSGIRSLEVTDESVVFRHSVSMDSGYGYDYVKEISLTGADTFRIRHRLVNTGTRPLKGDVYNHNFFTLGLLETGVTRELDFPFKPQGDWRAQYSEVGFTDNGIRFTRTLQRGESVYTGNLHEEGKGLDGSPNAFVLRELQTDRGVSCTCSKPMVKSVFWSNFRIACIEPYICFDIDSADIFEFDIDYKVL